GEALEAAIADVEVLGGTPNVGVVADAASPCPIEVPFFEYCRMAAAMTLPTMSTPPITESADILRREVLGVAPWSTPGGADTTVFADSADVVLPVSVIGEDVLSSTMETLSSVCADADATVARSSPLSERIITSSMSSPLGRSDRRLAYISPAF